VTESGEARPVLGSDERNVLVGDSRRSLHRPRSQWNGTGELARLEVSNHMLCIEHTFDTIGWVGQETNFRVAFGWSPTGGDSVRFADPRTR
jgi:hypothetical protein